MGHVFDKRLKTLRFCRAETRMYLRYAPVRPPKGQRCALADVLVPVSEHGMSDLERVEIVLLPPPSGGGAQRREAESGGGGPGIELPKALPPWKREAWRALG